MLNESYFNNMTKEELGTYAGNLHEIIKAFDGLSRAFSKEVDAVLTFRNTEQDRINANAKLSDAMKNAEGFEQGIADKYGIVDDAQVTDAMGNMLGAIMEGAKNE